MCQNKYNYVMIGKRIKEIRKNARLSQDDFILAANLPGTQRKRLGKIERGDADAVGKLDLDFFARVADFAGVSIGYILGEYDSSTREIQDIHDVTGLSEEAITSLMEMKEEQKINQSIIERTLPYDELESASYQKIKDNIAKKNGNTYFIDMAYQEKTFMPMLYGYLSIMPDYADESFLYDPVELRFMLIDSLLTSAKDAYFGFMSGFPLLDRLVNYVFRVEKKFFNSEDETDALNMYTLQEELFRAKAEFGEFLKKRYENSPQKIIEKMLI